MNSPQNRRLPWAAAAYCCLMAVGFCYGAWGLPWYMRHLTQLAVVGVGIFCLLFAGGHGRLASTGAFCRILALPFVWMLAFSLLCWAIDLRPLNYISRGISTLFYCLLALAAMGTAVCLFGVKAADYTLYGMCAANLGIVAYAIKSYGLPTFLREFAQYAASFGIDTPPAAKLLEVHDLTFAFGLMALYYLLFDTRRGHRLRAAAALFFFVLGWKRIGALALVAACAVFCLLRRLDGTRFKRACLLLAIAVLFGSEAFVFVIRCGYFDAFVAHFGLDTGGRQALWATFRDVYTFSPLFRGYGIGYTTRTVTLLTEAGVGIFGMHSYGGLHNDILTLYIELGFCGFALWVWECWHGRILRAYQRFGRSAALLLVCETAYVFVTYITDNTAFYCYVNTIFLLLPLAHVCSGQPDKERGGGTNVCKACKCR